MGRYNIKKTLTADNEVCHDIPGDPDFNSGSKCVQDGDADLNWNAARELLKQTSPAGDTDTRNIWTAMEGSSYIEENWDNFNEDNDAAISDLFALLEHDILITIILLPTVLLLAKMVHTMMR